MLQKCPTAKKDWLRGQGVQGTEIAETLYDYHWYLRFFNCITSTHKASSKIFSRSDFPWNLEHLENLFQLRVFVPKTGPKSLELSLLGVACARIEISVLVLGSLYLHVQMGCFSDLRLWRDRADRSPHNLNVPIHRAQTGLKGSNGLSYKRLNRYHQCQLLTWTGVKGLSLWSQTGRYNSKQRR